MYVQSNDGEIYVSVMSPTAVRTQAHGGERVRVAGVMLPGARPPTLMLPTGPDVEASVALCSQNAHVRQLQGTWGGGQVEWDDPCSPPTFYR